jgi:hypothetical protein
MPRTAAGGGVLVLAGALGAAVAGCAAGHNDEAGPMATDTARGIVAVVGAEPITHVVLRVPEGDLRLTGEAEAALRRAAGAEVWVAGRTTEDGGLVVDAFRVRASGGVEAADGVLELDGGTAVLVTSAGERLRYGPAPAGLRRLEGRHVWIAGTPGAEPQSWGVLEPEP